MTKNEKQNYTFDPLVSVIIPFYNIEKCVRYCLNSLLRQDYSNYEIICVDDGSSDATGKILDTYIGNDKIKIIHKKNGGLSEARNVGLENANGVYITFVDGDDFVHPEYISQMVKAIDKQSEAVVISLLRIVKYSDDMNIDKGWNKNITKKLVNKHDVLENMLYNKYSVSACGKLLHRQAYDKLRFPVGKVSEEVATIGQLLRNRNKFWVIEQPLYGYVTRDDSIGHKKEVPFRDIENRIEAFTIFEKELADEFDLRIDDDIRKAIEFGWALRYTNMAMLYEKVYDDVEGIKTVKSNVHKWLMHHIRSIISNSKAPVKQRVRFAIYTFFPHAYVILFKAYQKIKYGI